MKKIITTISLILLMITAANASTSSGFVPSVVNGNFSRCDFDNDTCVFVETENADDTVEGQDDPDHIEFITDGVNRGEIDENGNWTHQGNTQHRGSLANQIKTIDTLDYTFIYDIIGANSDYIVAFDGASNGVFRLPDPANIPDGTTFIAKNYSANALDIVPDNGVLVDGLASQTLSQNETTTYVYDKVKNIWYSTSNVTTGSLDTNVSGVDATLAGSILTLDVVEDGNTVSDSLDIGSIDTDISAVTATIAAGDLTIGVVEDGVTQSAVVNLPVDTDATYMDSLTGTVNKIGTIAENGNSYDINESISTLTIDDANRPTNITYTQEDNVIVNIPIGCELVTTTRAALIAKRNANDLDICDVYSFPITQASGNGSIYLTAIDLDKLSENASWYDATLTGANGWSASYDIDANELSYLHDVDLSNQVYGQSAINAFPWGVNTVTQNIVKDSIINYTAGNLTRSIISNNSTLNLTAGNVDELTMNNESILNISGGSFRLSTISDDATVTILSGDNYRNNVSYSIYNQIGTGYLRQNKIGSGSNIQNGNVNIVNSTFENATAINTTGTAGNISQSSFNRAVQNNMQNITALSLNDSTFRNYATINANGIARLYTARVDINSNGYLTLSGATTDLDLRYSQISSQGHIRQVKGKLFVWYTTVDSNGDIYGNSEGVTNRVERSRFSSEGFVEFRDTSEDNRLYRANVTGSANVYFYNGTSNARVNYLTVSDNSQVYVNNSTSSRVNNVSITARAVLNLQNNSAIHYLQHCTASSYATLHLLNNTGQVRMERVNASSQAIARIQNTAVNARLRYSNFTSFYYLLANFTTAMNADGLYGEGRRTRTVANPTRLTGTAAYNNNF